MASLTLRVAARYSQALKVAAFIPDKFFKGYAAEMKKILAISFGSSDPAMRQVTYHIYDKMIPLLKRFIQDLGERAPLAKPTLDDRLKLRLGILDKIVASYDKLRKDVGLEFSDSPRTTLDYVKQHIGFEVTRKISETIPTLGKALKVQFQVDPSKIDALARRALKKATPEQIQAIDNDDDYSNRTLELKYGFYREHVDGAAARLVKKEKVTVVDFVNWFIFLRDVLETNYSQPPRFTEFDLNGMKVVVDDATVTEKDHDKYVKYLDIAYQKLKAKKLARAWYGVVYIECEDCGGVNKNTGGDVGGHYNIPKDHVKIFNRPGPYIVELMAHELGHRYWYKSLKESQRAKFESIVRVYEGPSPDVIVPRGDSMKPEDIAKAKRRIHDAVDGIRTAFDGFRDAEVEPPFKELVLRFERRLHTTALWELPPYLPFSNAETEALAKRVTALREDLVKFLEDDHVDQLYKSLETMQVTTEEKIVELQKQRKAFLDTANHMLTTLQKESEKYVEEVARMAKEAEAARDREVKRLQEEREKAFAVDPRSVLPVSDYGKSNISEAFAEVFSWYVMDQKLTADQEASFRAVLLDKDRLATKVARRWLAGRASARYLHLEGIFPGNGGLKAVPS